MRPRLRPRPERVRLRPRPNDLASRPHGPRGLNIPGYYSVCRCSWAVASVTDRTAGSGDGATAAVSETFAAGSAPGVHRPSHARLECSRRRPGTASCGPDRGPWRAGMRPWGPGRGSWGPDREPWSARMRPWGAGRGSCGLGRGHWRAWMCHWGPGRGS